MTLKNYIKLTDEQLQRYKKLYEDYRTMTLFPEKSQPKFIINTPRDGYTWEEMLEDPYKMLKNDLDKLKTHLSLEDDRVLSTRVSFGTAQIAAAFGCEMYIPPNNLPCAKTHVLTDINDVDKLKMPALDAGWYKKLEQFTAFYLENLPEHVYVQLPDIQSTFNSAHLIRGNDIIFDFYDEPEILKEYLSFVTDYMIVLTKYLNKMIHHEEGWFFDWGALWKGNGRISNCTVHLISPTMYEEFILEQDKRFLEAINGGRMHYCGAHTEVFDIFLRDNFITGLDFDSNLHSLWTICGKLPANVPVLTDVAEDSKTIKRLLSGDWPAKKNIILNIYANSFESGKELLAKLRKSCQ
jgi:hypothetical protein